MDQIKIGKFISKKRKEKNITQSQLAEKLGITDRAISKWENGVCMPDIDNVIELSKILNVTINDLFSGEEVNMKDNEKILEKHLLEMTKLKEEKDKKLLNLEIVIGTTSSITFIGSIFLASYIEMPLWIRILLITFGIITFIIGMHESIGIEQKAGYYECSNCHHKYIPTYKNILFAMHIFRTRYLKCPKCNEKTWSKKVISK